MSEINNGGPAFPMTRVTVLAEDGTPNEAASITHEGMTLRDYFAAKAMQGICAHPDSWGLGDEGICKRSYEMADAMLKAREVK